ncbi:MAG: phosphopantetheine-binding protein [Oscillibacter sp.]|nr:phosphopantetheine-binding protein [Oscillibacter sp.]
MDQLLEILEDINPDNDYMAEDKLIDNGLLDSLSLLTLVSELEDAFGIEITPTDLIPANFNSAAAMWEMVQRLQEADK